jgi:hypothetical protein
LGSRKFFAPPEDFRLYQNSVEGRPWTGYFARKQLLFTGGRMKRSLIILILVCLLSPAFAGKVRHYKVHYSIHGSGKSIIVNAESSSDARRTVEQMIPGARVYSAREVK